jgi:hypothetical protein
VTGHVQGIYIQGSVNASGYSDVRITGCNANANVRNGILMDGVEFGAFNFSNVYVGYCTAYNNPGLAAQPSHTGSGIQLSSINGGVMEFCTAYNNGANNTAASGPIGLWFWQANNVIIQFCESYNNQSNGGDGGGFDLDGGVTNSFMQYNYSHGNKGAGFGIYQYATPLPFSNNVVRYNISQNDIGGGITLWGQDASSVVTNTAIYNNTVYNSVERRFG